MAAKKVIQIYPIPPSPQKRKIWYDWFFSRFNMRIPAGVHLPCQDHDGGTFMGFHDRANPRIQKNIGQKFAVVVQEHPAGNLSEELGPSNPGNSDGCGQG